MNFLFEFFLIWVSSHYFISKELVDSFSLNILGLMTSLRIVNPDGRSATLNLLLFRCRDCFMRLFFPSRYFYLGFGIDFFERIGLIIVKPISYFSSGLFIFDIFNLLRRFLFFLYDFDSNLMASFYSLSPLIRKVLFLSFM